MSETDQIAAALALAQAQMHPAAINKVNPHFRNRYADLASVIAAVREPLAANGLSFTQTTHVRDDGGGSPYFVLVTTLHHKSGQTIGGHYPLPMNVKPQELGSALTYARRYTLSSLCGISADEDDDGEATRKGNGAAPVEKITNEQTAKICSAAEAKGVSTESVCSYYGIDKVSDLPASQYDGAMKKLSVKGTNATGK